MVFSNQVGVLNYPAFAKTSYASQFSPPGSQPPTPKFHNYISVVLDTEDKLVPRCFPHFALHVSPHRILDYEVSALGFGPTGTEHFDTEQCKQTEADAEQIEEDEEESSGAENSRNNLDTERSKSRQGESEEAGSGNQEDEKSVSGSSAKDCKISENMITKKKFDIPKHVLDEVTANIYKSTTRKATEECPLPIPQRPAAFPSIIGSNKDRELYHSVYRRTGTWKTNVVPEAWERAQERPLYEDPKAKQYRPCRLRFSKPKPRLLSKRQQPNEVSVTRIERPASLPLRVEHIRPSPGYGGFVPKLPVVPSPARDPRLMLSSSAAAYRNVPSEGLRIQEYAHKGPLSKLVTTTTPCNPFNKTTQMSQLTSGIFVI